MSRRTRSIGFIAFVLLLLVAAYIVRKTILERHLVAAMEMNDTALVRSLLDSWPCPVNARFHREEGGSWMSGTGGTPLHWAAGRREMMELLIAKGADVNAREGHGFTPLHLVSGIIGTNEECAALLIANGADVNAKDNENATALHWALFGGDEGMARMLVDKGAQVDVFAASGLGRVDKVEEFLKQNPGLLYAEVLQGWTPLHFAARCGRQEVAALLLSKGAAVDAQDEVGRTPLHEAAWSGDTPVAELLIAKGADVNAKDPRGWTPLHSAALNGHKGVVQLLLAKGADINAKARGEETPLKTSISMGQDGIADLLRKHGAKE